VTVDLNEILQYMLFIINIACLQDPIVKKWIKAGKDDGDEHEVMIIHMLPKYAI
jgi:hypothetical protein